MPNHISNEIIIHSDNYQEALDYMRTDNVDDYGKKYTRHFDFNKIKQMPEELNIESSTSATAAHILYLQINNIPVHPKYNYSPMNYNFVNRYRDEYDMRPGSKMYELGKQVHTNWEKYGYPNWYEWSYANWGTKWNAYTTKYTSDRSVYFESAWGAPLDIVEGFIHKFKLTCTYRAICEGSILWFIREYENGTPISIRDQLPEDHRQLYIDLRGYDPEEEDEEDEE